MALFGTVIKTQHLLSVCVREKMVRDAKSVRIKEQHWVFGPVVDSNLQLPLGASEAQSFQLSALTMILLLATDVCLMILAVREWLCESIWSVGECHLKKIMHCIIGLVLINYCPFLLWTALLFCHWLKLSAIYSSSTVLGLQVDFSYFRVVYCAVTKAEFAFNSYPV